MPVDPFNEIQAVELLEEAVVARLLPAGTVALMLHGRPLRVSVCTLLRAADGRQYVSDWGEVPWGACQWAHFDGLPLVRLWLHPWLDRHLRREAA